MKKLIAALVGVAFVSLMAGCNTIAGAGEDTAAAGKKIENSAERNKKY